MTMNVIQNNELHQIHSRVDRMNHDVSSLREKTERIQQEQLNFSQSIYNSILNMTSTVCYSILT